MFYAYAPGWALQLWPCFVTYSINDIGDDPAIRANLLPLNNESARETSPLDAAKLARMIEAARVATFAGPGAAFLLAFDQDAAYDSPNFIWFRERFDSFIYIDRVIVGAAYRRSGLGRLLYEDLFRKAERLGFPRIACEVNIRPPNPVSDAFHERLGFAEVGTATSCDGTKSVRYLMREAL
jgi:predicted GNAT superfamily acetyltransferase